MENLLLTEKTERIITITFNRPGAEECAFAGAPP